MENTRKKLITAAVATVVSVGLASITLPVSAAKAEKCYGIVKKGKNDCGTKLHACAAQSKMNGDPTEWIFVPKGTCNKIVGGSLKSGKAGGGKKKS